MSDTEVWKPIPGFEGYYEASTLGIIRSVDRIVQVKTMYATYPRFLKGKVVKQTFDGKGCYLQAMLSKDGIHKKYLTHRLVAQTFIANPMNLPEVNHKDEDKTNNSVSNLEWCDHVYNNNYGSKLHKTRGENNPQNKFTAETVREIRRLYIPGDSVYGSMGLSKMFGISPSHTTAILKRRRWGWLD